MDTLQVEWITVLLVTEETEISLSACSWMHCQETEPPARSYIQALHHQFGYFGVFVSIHPEVRSHPEEERHQNIDVRDFRSLCNCVDNEVRQSRRYPGERASDSAAVSNPDQTTPKETSVEVETVQSTNTTEQVSDSGIQGDIDDPPPDGFSEDQTVVNREDKDKGDDDT